MRITEADLWVEGTDAEFAAIAASEVGQPLAGHPNLVCALASVEQAADVIQARPDPRPATPDEVEAGEYLIPGPAFTPDGKPATRVIHLPTPPPLPGKKRLRLHYVLD